MLEIMTNEAESSAKIIVIGVGGAGHNAVTRMVEDGVGGVEVVGVKLRLYFRLVRKLRKVSAPVHSRRLDRRQLRRALRKLRRSSRERTWFSLPVVWEAEPEPELLL